ncbi:BatA domain-containing protein [Aestuariivivens sediminis]|uniref:BatA domain-containing protein n=1 Tax=Aestuariivivens sediminis TaxID=2913557 RepID=UPI001F55FDE1|nr:BatA domain-containing protein [Aestuariivivens sediminis]
MQFKHPEILYALFLLLIPLIVHLFQLRKFKKEAFTNVAFLKKATLQTRKSSEIKRWLILITRLLLFAAIILAFAQPYFSKTKSLNAKSETVIYLDNSFSMQAKGGQGELLKRAVQDVIANVPEDETISLFTNDVTYKNTTVKALKNDLLQLQYTAVPLSAEAALLKGNTLFKSPENTVKNMVFISDFQEAKINLDLPIDSLTNLHLVKLKPVNTDNIAIDSMYISNSNATTLELTVSLKNSGQFVKDLPVSLYDNTRLIAKTSVDLDQKAQTTFSLPKDITIQGRVIINDSSLQFDNILYFNINDTEKINVLAINQANDAFLKRIYSSEEFNYLTTGMSQLDYNVISDQQLIILNELEQIPASLMLSLNAFVKEGGSIIIIPSNTINPASYNTLLVNYNLELGNYSASEKKITSINFSHPLYHDGVFEKQVSNFQYPKVNSHYTINSNKVSSALKFENDSAFLCGDQNVYVFASALNDDNSNFKSSPLIVPTLYNIGRFSLNLPNLYYTIGQSNSFDISTNLQQDDILSLRNDQIMIIPRQQQFNSKVVIKTQETPAIAGTYAVTNKDQTLAAVSYNYNRKESDLIYNDLSHMDPKLVSDSVIDVFNTIKSDVKINALWKWFVIFALLLLIIEMLILKYFK